MIRHVVDAVLIATSLVKHHHGVEDDGSPAGLSTIAKARLCAPGLQNKATQIIAAEADTVAPSAAGTLSLHHRSSCCRSAERRSGKRPMCFGGQRHIRGDQRRPWHSFVCGRGRFLRWSGRHARAAAKKSIQRICMTFRLPAPRGNTSGAAVLRFVCPATDGMVLLRAGDTFWCGEESLWPATMQTCTWTGAFARVKVKHNCLRLFSVWCVNNVSHSLLVSFPAAAYPNLVRHHSVQPRMSEIGRNAGVTRTPWISALLPLWYSSTRTGTDMHLFLRRVERNDPRNADRCDHIEEKWGQEERSKERDKMGQPKCGVGSCQ